MAGARTAVIVAGGAEGDGGGDAVAKVRLGVGVGLVRGAVDGRVGEGWRRRSRVGWLGGEMVVVVGIRVDAGTRR